MEGLQAGRDGTASVSVHGTGYGTVQVRLLWLRPPERAVISTAIAAAWRAIDGATDWSLTADWSFTADWGLTVDWPLTIN